MSLCLLGELKEYLHAKSVQCKVKERPVQNPWSDHMQILSIGLHRLHHIPRDSKVLHGGSDPPLNPSLLESTIVPLACGTSPYKDQQWHSPVWNWSQNLDLSRWMCLLLPVFPFQHGVGKVHLCTSLSVKKYYCKVNGEIDMVREEPWIIPCSIPFSFCFHIHRLPAGLSWGCHTSSFSSRGIGVVWDISLACIPPMFSWMEISHPRTPW